MSSAEDQLRSIIETAMQENSYKQASAPFGDKIDEAKTQFVTNPSAETENVKTLTAFKTGTNIDAVFLNVENKPIDGLPYGSNSILTGLPNSGKSLLLEEIALKVADNGKKVCYTTSEEIWKTESSRFDLENRMKEKAKILGISWDTIRKNLFVLDAVAHAELRDWYTFVAAYRQLVEKEKVEMLLVDSITMLEDSRGQLKYRLAEISKYNQLHGITAIMINQRSIEESDGLAMAGGIALSHVVDIVMILDYKKVWTGDGAMKIDTGAKQGEVLFFFRTLKCRICKFDARYLAYKISNNGLVEFLPKPTIPVAEQGVK